MMEPVVLELVRIAVWGLLATLALTAVSFASQNMGWSRLNFPLLLGTLFTAERKPAIVLGFIFFVLVGWLIALAYYVVLWLAGGPTLWRGIVLALAHGALILTVALPLLPHVHPRMATHHDGATFHRRLQPPGFLALHYGAPTPLVVMMAYALYGAVLGWGFAA